MGDIRDREWVADQLDQGVTVTDLARSAGVSRQTAHTWLGRHGLEGASRAKPRPTPARLNRMYARLRSSSAVAAELGVSTDTARRWLIAAGVEMAAGGRPRSRLDVAALRRRQAAGVTLGELAADAGVSVETLRRHLSKEDPAAPRLGPV